MATLSQSYEKMAKKILPSPFTIAILLSVLTFLLAVILTKPLTEFSYVAYVPEVAMYWQQGFWELLSFTMQMMLILVLGHILALTKTVNAFINQFVKFCTTTSRSAFIVAFVTIVVAYLNWGLGLIFGAIFARKVAEYATRHNITINYPLIGTAGYTGLMVWHGGLSGSAPVIVAGEDHFLVDQIGIISMGETVFSVMNIAVAAALLTLIPLALWLLGKGVAGAPVSLAGISSETEKEDKVTGAERLDFSKLLGVGAGLIFVLAGLYKAFVLPKELSLNFLDLNYINFMLFGFGLLLHGSVFSFLRAADDAIRGSTGIMIQFPVYAGIMGMMKYSGLIVLFSDFFVSISTDTTFPLFTFISAGLVNIFVPSGGGQWAVQGPIIVQASAQLGVPVSKSIMALAYGDQLTNMLQPFWALPLLGITGLRASDILPYTLVVMMIGIFIFAAGLLLF